MAEGSHLLGAEHVRGDQLPCLAPVLAVGRKRDVRRAVPDDVGGGGRWPGRENVVVRSQDGLGCAQGGHDHGGHGAEVKEQEAVVAVPGGEVTERGVEVGADQVEVAEDGQLPWR